jgi:hypothetical protein
LVLAAVAVVGWRRKSRGRWAEDLIREAGRAGEYLSGPFAVG